MAEPPRTSAASSVGDGLARNSSCPGSLATIDAPLTMHGQVTRSRPRGTRGHAMISFGRVARHRVPPKCAARAGPYWSITVPSPHAGGSAVSGSHRNARAVPRHRARPPLDGWRMHLPAEGDPVAIVELMGRSAHGTIVRTVSRRRPTEPDRRGGDRSRQRDRTVQAGAETVATSDVPVVHASCQCLRPCAVKRTRAGVLRSTAKPRWTRAGPWTGFATST